MTRPQPTLSAGPAWTLCLVAISLPFWTSYLTSVAGAVTVGRLALALLIGILGLALWQQRRGIAWALPPPAIAALTSLVVLLLVVGGSAATRGCTCDGAAAGFAEWVAVALAGAAAIALAPRYAATVLAAAAGAGVLLAVLALAGVDDVHTAATLPPLPPGTRLAGPLRNPNLLALPLALVTPVLAAGILALRRAARLWALGGLVLCVMAIVATYSRGGVLAVGGGVLAAALGAGVRLSPRAAAIAGACAAAGVVVIFVGPFANARRDSDFGSAEAAGAALDRSGWDARSIGFVAAGARLFNSPGGTLSVRIAKPGQGVSLPLAPHRDREPYTIAFTASAGAAQVPFAYALGDAAGRAPASSATGVLTPVARAFTLRFTPASPSAPPRFYLWLPTTRATVTVHAVTVRGPPGQAPVAVGLRLRGSLAGKVRSAAQRKEEGFMESRVRVAREAVRVFGGHPLIGIGWERFATLAARRLGRSSAGAYATHNEILRFAAELGIAGLLPLLALIGSLGVLLRRLTPGPLRGALAGVLGAGLVGVLFVNALATPSVSLPLALGVAIVLGLSVQPRSVAQAPLAPR